MGKVLRNAALAFLFWVVANFDEFEGNLVGIVEIDPLPSGQYTFIDRVGVGEEVDAFGPQFSDFGANVLDMKRKVHGSQIVLLDGGVIVSRTVCVLEEFQNRRLANLQRHLAKLCAGNAHGIRQGVALKPGAGFIDKVQPEDVVIKVNRPVGSFTMIPV